MRTLATTPRTAGSSRTSSRKGNRARTLRYLRLKVTLLPLTTQTPTLTQTAESADNASLRSSDASWTVSNDWIVDTGATAHMTPHRHWFVSMVPCKTPIRLADKSIVYSEGKGVVHFAPRDSKLVVAVTDVLYVPLLGCNLFSALHLTQHKDF